MAATTDRNSPNRVSRALARTSREGIFLEGVVALSIACLLVVLANHVWLASRLRVWEYAGLAGMAIPAGFILARRWSPLRAARVLEREHPELQQGLLAFATGPETAFHGDLEQWLLARPLRARHARLRAGALVSALVAGGAVAWSLRARTPEARPVAVVGTKPAVESKLAGTRFALGIRIVPPRYTGLPARDAVIPGQGTLDVLAGSRVSVSITLDGSSPSPLIWSVPGAPPERLDLGTAGVLRHLELRADLAIRIETTDREPFTRLLLFHVRTDRPPDLELVSPKVDQTLQSAPSPFVVEALAQDDFGVATATLRFTLAHGRGEGMTFKNGTLPSSSRNVAGNGLRLTSRLDPKAFGFGLGDTLVLWAEAADRNDVTGPGLTRSSPRVLRWEDATATLDMPQSASRVLAREAPLSERELLKRTKRLVTAHPSPAALREQALDLAEQQRGIRLRFAVFTREENADSTAVMDVETAETNPLGPPKQERLLAQAVDAMWRAERALTAGEPRNAIPPEQDALRLLDDAFGRERISLTALAAPSASVDLKKRLTGDAKGLGSWTDATPQDPEESARRTEARALARFLDAAALGGPVDSRTLGDRVFSSRPLPGFEPPAEAAGFYSAKDEADLGRRSRALSLRLLALLDGAPALALPASAREGAVTRLLEGAAPPRSRR